MTSVIMAKSSFMNVSKVGLPPQASYLCSRNVSRVCFTSATIFNGNQYARENVAGYKGGRAAERIRVKADGTNQVGDVMQDAADKIKKDFDAAAKNVQEGADWAGKGITEAHEKNMDSAEWAAEKVKEEASKAGEALQGAKESTQANIQDTADWTADKAKEGANKVEETAKGAWESVKDAAQKIQETVEQDK
ncbi:hypothetical protein SOVF_162800 [Spinacia oleracea]|uniref:Late embryogenesis abundant protein At3g53040 n=1 Tax=Spinacia oleracea TaxID=3562 RepID=A0A9R0KCM8_SPIOL|nr:late embryogenesis abundant protein At3g53040-like [Spinacia oleracea]KNA08404.1 hypothetical protein SOVF_162800 [Spinacia oleracea]